MSRRTFEVEITAWNKPTVRKYKVEAQSRRKAIDKAYEKWLESYAVNQFYKLDFDAMAEYKPKEKK